MNEHVQESLDLKAIGRRVRCQREALNLTREKLAEDINLSSKFCADIEYGTRGMSLSTVAKLALALNVSIDYLVYGRFNNSERANDENSLLLENILAPLYCCDANQLKKAGGIVKMFADAIRGELNDD